MLADRRGRQTTNVQGYVTTIRSFNDQGLPLSESYSGGPLANLSVTNQFLRRTNVSLLNSSTPKLTNSAAFDAASRLQLLTDGSNSAYCGYVANSMLLSQIAFANGSAQRMVTTETYYFLNRLTSIPCVPSASSVVSFSYIYNSANQRTRMVDDGWFNAAVYIHTPKWPDEPDWEIGRARRGPLTQPPML